MYRRILDKKKIVHTEKKSILNVPRFNLHFRARKDSEVSLDAQKYAALVRVLSKNGKLEGWFPVILFM